MRKIEDILQMLKSGTWMRAGASDLPEVSALLLECADRCHELNMMPPSLSAEREVLLRRLLGSVGDCPTINSPFRCDFGFNIHIGHNFVGNFNLTILDEATVNIGDNVRIGPNCSLTTITHALDALQRNQGVMQARPITIGDNVWLASNVVVLPGVEIGNNTVIGAGSVVTKSIPSDSLAMGTPCKILRRIDFSDRVDVIDCND